LVGESALGDLAIHGLAGQPGAGQYGFQADDSFKVRHGICFHSLTVVGTPLEEQLANKMPVASACFGPSGPSVHKETATKRRREKATEAKIQLRTPSLLRERR
jgi:hypothetical protein